MGNSSATLVGRFTELNDKMISIVEQCSDGDWNKACTREDWTVGVVARHVSAMHYSLIALVKRIVAGKELPKMNMDAMHQQNAQHAQEHAHCTKEDVLEMFRKNGSSIAAYVSSLSDEELARSAHFPLSGNEITAKQLINVLINGSTEHLESLQAELS